MIDELIMLLSTDWFLPFWAEVGIDVGETKRNSIQLGCRGIVSQIVGRATLMFQVDFSEERKQETSLRFLSLLKECGAETELSAACREWANRPDQELTAVWNCAHLNRRISKGDIPEGLPHLNADIKMEVENIWSRYDLVPFKFKDIARSSETDWDTYIHSLAGGSDLLSTVLQRVLLSYKLKEFWDALRKSLTQQQMQNLVLWYRAMNKGMSHKDRPDLILSYME
jgi:hypothetical protein